MRYYELTEARPKNFRGRKFTQDQIDTDVSNWGGNMEEWNGEVGNLKYDLAHGAAEYLNNDFGQFVDSFNRYLNAYEIPIEIVDLIVDGDEIKYKVV